MNAPVKQASASEIERELNRFKGEHAEVAVRLTELEAGYDSVLLTGDDKRAEKHEGEIARAKRSLARIELQLPLLEGDLLKAKEAEEQRALAARQAAANAAVQAVLADVDNDYTKHAAAIVDFLNRWSVARALAVEAGVDTPDRILRVKSGAVHPARVMTETYWRDWQGAETAEKPKPPGAYVIDPKTGEEVPSPSDHDLRDRLARCSGPFTRPKTIDERREPDVYYGLLADLVALPVIDDRGFHYLGDGLTKKPQQ